MTTTVTGATLPTNFSGASGASAAYFAAFGPGTLVNTISQSGVYSSTGPDSLTGGPVSVTVSGSAISDGSAGGNTITTLTPATIFAAPNDTIDSAAATTLFGASGGTTTFALSGADSSITGGAGYISGIASGANTTLVGGTGGAAFTVGGSGSLAVAGTSGTTTVTLAETAGGAQVSVNPDGTVPGGMTGTLIATLSPTGADTVIGGFGSVSVQGGGGDDVFAFVQGAAGSAPGHETISGFTSSDNFAFASSYGANPIKSEVFTADTSTTGTDVITLSDNTTITVIGNLTHSIFGK